MFVHENAFDLEENFKPRFWEGKEAIRNAASQIGNLGTPLCAIAVL